MSSKLSKEKENYERGAYLWPHFGRSCTAFLMASVTREMHQATLKSMWSPSAVSQPAPVETSSAPLEGLLSGTTMKRVTNSGTTTANPVPTAPLLARDAQPREAQQKDEGEEQLQQLHNTAATKTNSESSPTGLTPLQPTAAAAQKMLGGEHALASGPITPVRRNEARAASAVSERGQQQQAKRDGKAPKMTNSELKKKTAAAAAATTAGAHAGGAVDGYAGPAVEAQAKLQLVPRPKAATKSKAAGSESTTIAGKRTARKATTAKTPAKTTQKRRAKFSSCHRRPRLLQQHLHRVRAAAASLLHAHFWSCVHATVRAVLRALSAEPVSALG